MHLHKPKAHWMCFIAMTILLFIGFIMMFSTSSVVGLSNYNDAYFFTKKHAFYLVIGTFAFLVGLKIPYQFYKKIVGPGLLITCCLLALTLIPGIGVKVGGASRWLNLGLFNIQPVELVKFFIICFVALSIENKQQVLDSFSKGLMPILLLIAFPILVLGLQPDLGNIGVITLVIGVLFFLSKIPFKFLFSLGIGGVLILVINVLLHPYQLDRITSFLNPWADPLGKNYHVIQSLTAIGSGGIFGLGIGESKLKYFYLPLQYSDFIFSIICEEGGLILATLVIGLYGMLFLNGMTIARQAKDVFGFYLASGLTLLLVLQAIINIAVVTGLMPVTGIPLTFLSFGGTSLIMSMFFVGVLMSIGKTKSNLKPTE